MTSEAVGGRFAGRNLSSRRGGGYTAERPPAVGSPCSVSGVSRVPSKDGRRGDADTLYLSRGETRACGIYNAQRGFLPLLPLCDAIVWSRSGLPALRHGDFDGTVAGRYSYLDNLLGLPARVAAAMRARPEGSDRPRLELGRGSGRTVIAVRRRLPEPLSPFADRALTRLAMSSSEAEPGVASRRLSPLDDGVSPFANGVFSGSAGFSF